jgi:type IV pilus assembly protein PilQ
MTMKSPKRKKIYWGILLLVIPVIFLITGCASREKVEPVPTAATQNLVKNIAIKDSDDGKRIIVEGEAPLAYTFFRLIPQPLKLVVDIPQTALAPEVTTTLPVDDEVIQKIILLQHDEDVEIAIHLNKLVRYKVQKEGVLLYVDVKKRRPLLAKEEEKKDEIKIVKEIPPSVKEEDIAKELAPAKSLVDVFVDTSQKDKVILRLKADGRLGDYNSFELQKPTRLVIDLWKVKRKFRKKAISVNSPYLKRVRLGDHPQKVRVVLDVPTTALPSHRIDRIGDEVKVVLGKEVTEEILVSVPEEVVKVPEEVVREPEEIAKEPEKVVTIEEEKVPPPITVTGEILGIDFKQLEDKSRITISTSAKALYEVEKGPENTVLVEIKGMTVPPKLSRPLDTHEFASPVFMITPINVVVGDQKSTQVLVKLRKMVAFDVKQENDRIYLDFARPEEFKVEKPKPIEVVTVEKPPAEKELEKPAVEEKAEPEGALVAPPTPAPQVTPPVPAEEEEVEKVYTGKKITLDFKDADIDNILRLFAEVSDLNIIATEDVKGTVTVRLVDVPWDQAFDIILQSKNLGVERIGNVVRIAPLERISAEKRARAEAVKATEELAPLVTELIQVNYSTAGELAPKVKGLLSDRGSVTVDERTNTLIVKDIQVNLITARELVRRLDAQTPQVLIQAKVIEANLDFGRELGISWGGNIQEDFPDENVSVTGSGAATAGDFVVDLPAPVGTGAGGAMEFLIANLANTKYLQVKISAIEERGQGRIISSPRVTTLDHTEASIEQGLRIPYLKLTEEGTATTDFIEANLKLTVTPHVTADGHIKMELTISKDTPDQSITVMGVPSIDKKEVKTEVLVKDGEVVVIGGIYTFTKTASVDAVPLFYKIPLLGWLFQKRRKDDDKRELLIFIAPRIVQPRRTVAS